MRKILDTHDKMFILLVSLFTVFMWIGSSVIFSDISLYNRYSKSTDIEVIEPNYVEKIDSSTKYYYFSNSQIKKAGGCLKFYTVYKQIQVFADSELLYERKKSKSPFGRNSGDVWNFVEIDDEIGGNVVVSLKNDFNNLNDNKVKFYAGDEAIMFYNFILDGLSEHICTLLEILLGGYTFLNYMFVGRKKKKRPYVLYYSALLMIVGTWSTLEADISKAVLDNKPSVYFMEYEMLLLGPYMAVLFVDSYYNVRKNIVSEIVKGISVISTTVCTILQLTGILEFRMMLDYIQGIIVITIIYFLFALFTILRRSVDTMYVTRIILETILVVSGTILALIVYRLSENVTNIYVDVVMLAYSAGLWYNITKHEITIDEENKRIEIYRSQAEYDVLTNMKNRNSFEIFMRNNKVYEGYTVLVFDLNNLKYCNDTQGHKAGDRFIIAAANCIKDVFENLGQCYRIGGDEFCVIIKRSKESEIETLLNDLTQIQMDYNNRQTGTPLEFAVGYAIYSKVYDYDLDSTFSRADKMMYSNKRMFKTKN